MAYLQGFQGFFISSKILLWPRKLDDQRLDRRAKREKLVEFISTLTKRDGLLTEFDEDLWNATIETVTVDNMQYLKFCFKDGAELPWTME